MKIIKETHIFTVKSSDLTLNVSENSYNLVEGASGKTWLVPSSKNPESIYLDTKHENSQGFGGKVIDFKLEGGELHFVKGPWLSSADALLDDTGIDLTQAHFTQGVIALKIEAIDTDKYYATEFKCEKVLYLDEKPVMGDFNRVADLAQKFANDLQKTVRFRVVSSGGSIMASRSPLEISSNID